MRGSKNLSVENYQALSALRRCYEFLSRFFCQISAFCLVAALVFDLLPWQYCSPAVEAFFCRSDFSAYVSTSLVGWTFGASLLLYFIGKMENCWLGIRFGEALLAHESLFSLVRKAGFFLLEIILLEFVPTDKLPITFFMVCLLQPFNIVLSLLMIFVETSRDKVLDTTHKQNKRILTQLGQQMESLPEGQKEDSGSGLRKFEKELEEERRQWLLFKVLRTLCYSRYEDMEYLEDCLPPTFWIPIQDHPALCLVLSWKLGRAILENIADEHPAAIPAALMTLLLEVAENPNYPQEVKEGLLAALAVSWEAPDCSERFREMLYRMEDQARGAAIDWSCCLLRDLGNACSGRDLLLDWLEKCGADYSCAFEHILPADRQQRLNSFVDYLTGQT